MIEFLPLPVKVYAYEVACIYSRREYVVKFLKLDEQKLTFPKSIDPLLKIYVIVIQMLLRVHVCLPNI